MIGSQLHISPDNARTYDEILKAVKRRYYSEHPICLTTLVFEDADYVRLHNEPQMPGGERSILATVCTAVYQQFDIRTVYTRSNYTRAVTSALTHINRTRAAVQRPLDPSAAGWTDDDVFAEARRLGWRSA